MKWLLAICACILVASISVANPFVLKSEVKTIADGPVQGTWMETEFGTVGACSKSGRVEFPFCFAYYKHDKDQYPYAMRFDERTGEILLQMPVPVFEKGAITDRKTLLIPMKHIATLVESSLSVRHAGEFKSGDEKITKPSKNADASVWKNEPTYRPTSEPPDRTIFGEDSRPRLPQVSRGE